ncbi:MAG: hypothetical protein U0Y82_03145 [Thermoleophilia bacterium]
MTTVNRCIAVAAHGRRCQQSTYRGGPYCWHHTQSRKVWRPSRVSSGPIHGPVRAPDTVGTAPVTALPVRTPKGPPLERIAAHLTPDQLAMLADFLDHPGDGAFRIETVSGVVTWAHRDRVLPYPRRSTAV